MKTHLLAALLVLPAVAYSAPFVVGCVPASASAADKYVISGATHAPLNGEFPITANPTYCPVVGTRAVVVDVAAVPEGDNTLSIALKSDLWGVLGAPVPFAFNRPVSASLVVNGIQLVP